MNDFYKKENELLEHCRLQASELLKSFGEFYPFAMGMDESFTFYSVNTYDGVAQPDVTTHLEQLIDALPENSKTNNYVALVVCLDVRVIPPYTNEKMDAIELRLNNKYKVSANYCIPYILNGKEIELYEVFEMEGTLHLWK
ncbi:MAG: hypothetical protein ACXWDO_03470 [Bacteroidia bacterium]